MREGDAIWFTQTCRGGYGFQRDVPGMFVRQSGANRVTVLLQRKTGEPVQVQVHPKNVRLRASEETTR